MMALDADLAVEPDHIDGSPLPPRTSDSPMISSPLAWAEADISDIDGLVLQFLADLVFSEASTVGPDHDGSHFKNFIRVAAVSNHLHPRFGNEVGKAIVSYYWDFDFWRGCLSEIREPRGRAEILEGAKRTFE
jgi:hypothetical protein